MGRARRPARGGRAESRARGGAGDAGQPSGTIGGPLSVNLRWSTGGERAAELTGIVISISDGLTSWLCQIFLANGEAANAFSGGFKDGIAHGRRNAGSTGFAGASG